MIRAALGVLARRLGVRRARRLVVGPGRGLRFEAGPSNPAYATGANELPVQEALTARLRPGDVFVDVGANVGFLSVIAARLVGPGGRVVAFEPVPANAALVRRNASANGFAWIEVVEAAVADRNGAGRLVLAEYSGGAALDTAAPPPDACGELAVTLVTLDAWLAGRPELRPAMVKIDVEGAEPEALHGMRETLTHARPTVVVELDDAEAATARAKAERCRAWLADLDYHVWELPDAYPDIDWHVIHLLAEPDAPTSPAATG